MKILKGNIVKCDKCKSFLQYNDNDIENVQMYYSINTYDDEHFQYHYHYIVKKIYIYHI